MKRRRSSPRRVSPQIANQRLVGTVRRLRNPVSLKRLLGAIERRFFHFDPVTRPVSVRRRDGRIVMKRYSDTGRVVRKTTTGYERSLPARLFFEKPYRVDLCVRRKIRKEVLHALGVAGSGRKMKRPRRNEYSEIGC